jgi:nucleoside-diphosphate-sugar epimerase
MRVKDARQTFLGTWLKRVIANEPIEIWGDGLQMRDFNYVDDVVDALLLAAASDAANGMIYNLGSGETINLCDLAQKLIALNGGGAFHVIPFPPDRKAIDIGDYYSDFALIRTQLGWSPSVDLDEGLHRTLEFYRAHREYYW